jgi:hypothetical protein
MDHRESFKTHLFEEIKETFARNQDSVRQLMDFDRILIDFCIVHIEALESRLKNNKEIQLTSAHFLPSHTIEALKSIRKNDSMRPQYKSIFNQCLVLSVSHFSSAVHSIFKQAINHACCCCPDLLTASNEDIKFSFEELKNYHFDLTDSLGDLVIKKKDISFQDMQSAHRAFKNFLNVECEKDIYTNDIIFAQAARHSIVHALGHADEKFIKQIKDAFPRQIKDDIKPEELIQFESNEIENVLTSMDLYINRLIENIEQRIYKSIWPKDEILEDIKNR